MNVIRQSISLILLSLLLGSSTHPLPSLSIFGLGKKFSAREAKYYTDYRQQINEALKKKDKRKLDLVSKALFSHFNELITTTSRLSANEKKTVLRSFESLASIIKFRGPLAHNLASFFLIYLSNKSFSARRRELQLESNVLREALLGMKNNDSENEAVFAFITMYQRFLIPKITQSRLTRLFKGITAKKLGIAAAGVTATLLAALAMYRMGKMTRGEFQNIYYEYLGKRPDETIRGVVLGKTAKQKEKELIERVADLDERISATWTKARRKELQDKKTEAENELARLRKTGELSEADQSKLPVVIPEVLRTNAEIAEQQKRYYLRSIIEVDKKIAQTRNLKERKHLQEERENLRFDLSQALQASKDSALIGAYEGIIKLIDEGHITDDFSKLVKFYDKDEFIQTEIDKLANEILRQKIAEFKAALNEEKQRKATGFVSKMKKAWKNYVTDPALIKLLEAAEGKRTKGLFLKALKIKRARRWMFKGIKPKIQTWIQEIQQQTANKTEKEIEKARIATS